MSLPASIDLTDRVAIVTGGSRGIGKGISLELARRGASVSIIYSNPARLAQAQETVSEIKSLGVKAVAIIADLKDPKSHAVIVKETLEGLGAKEIHILVHNAGQANTTHTPDMTPEVLSEVLDTNFCGPYLLTQAVLPYIPRGGRIIFISSISARYPTPGDRMRVPLYAASKAAVEALCREWAFEFGHSRGLTVNAVAPGLVKTEILKILPADLMEELDEANAPATAAEPRMGTPDDVAQVVAFLASEGSRWITGSTVSANGGRIFF